MTLRVPESLAASPDDSSALPAELGLGLPAVADAISEIVVICDDRGELQYANGAWTEFTGLTLDASLGALWLQAVDDPRPVAAVLAEHAASRAPLEIGARLRRHDGAYRLMRVRARPLGGAWAATCVDIEEFKRAEAQRDAFRTLAGSGAIGLFASDARGILIEANEKFLNMTGYSRQDLEDRKLHWGAMTPPEWAAADALAIERFQAYGSVEPYEKEYVCKDGSRVPIAIGVAGANESGVICYVSDLRERKRVEAAQRVSDQRLRRLFDANVVGIVISNNAGAILEANDAFLHTIGYTRRDLERGLVDWRKLTPPEWLYLDERAIADMATNGVFSQYEKEYVRKDGTRVPISVGGARIADTADQQICYIVDLSEIRSTESALRRSESRFARLRDANVIGIMTSRLGDGAIVEANDEFLRTIGYARAEFVAGALAWSDLTPPEWQGAGERAARDLRSYGRFAPYEKEYLRKDGSRVPVLVGGARVDDEASDEIISYVLDLSEQRRAMLATAESELRYRTLAEAVPLIVMLADENRSPIYVNRQYEDYTGLTSSEIPYRWREVIHPDDLAAVDAARASNAVYEVEYRLRRRSDGAYRWHFARCLNFTDELYGTRWLAGAMDIDDRKRAEESLRFIERASTLLSKSLDLPTTFETLLDLVVPDFGDWAAISLRHDDGSVKIAVARHMDPAKAHLARDVCGIEYLSGANTVGTGAVYQTGRPQLKTDFSYDDLRSAVKESCVDTFAQMGFGSLIALPIFSGEDVVGSFSIVSAGDRRTYTAADLPSLEELARRAGYAIQNAREYEREHRVASILQEAALPRTLPAVAGFTFDGYYRAGRSEASIGGDWFDAVVVSERRIVVSVGDVAGSGLHAAVLMGSVRQIIRGAAHVYDDPALMFEIAERTLRSGGEDRMVTAFVGVIDPVARTMVYASAGHMPALLRTADGEVRELHAKGLPLGYRNIAPAETKTVDLPPGSCLLIYTDGLVEWSRNVLEGVDRLIQRFGETFVSGEPQAAKVLVDGILPATGARDDVAALTVAVAL